jgi:outer membrane protein OmpA-like peptidoglycan-associated protein
MSGLALLFLLLGLRELERAGRLELARSAAEARAHALEQELELERRKYGVQRQVVESIRQDLERRGVAVTVNRTTGNLEISADMLFALGEHQISPRLQPSAQLIGKAIVPLLEDAALGASIGMLMVVGHTDQEGDAERNLVLANQRAAQLVKLWHGDHRLGGGGELPRCAAAKIVAAAMGESRPLVLAEQLDGAPNPACGNQPDERRGCRRNRRIELKVVPKDGKATEIEGCH